MAHKESQGLRKPMSEEAKAKIAEAVRIAAQKKKDFTKNKVAVVTMDGYDDYYLVNAKDMKVENTDISQVNSDMKVGKIKQLFSKSMKGRITSRVLLNKFIDKVA